ncbi:hypothetical protein QTP86_004398 [Hemibagrus guttatus]|nr:hypothetical protein QTP86_004398 [Hemibagrus guttatus]
MDSYIEEAQAARLIRPFTSPEGAGVFFVGKKGGGLRPCIDYRGLNKITIHNCYPLPLMATASVFTKLDLCNAYHLVHIRQAVPWVMVCPCGSTTSSSEHHRVMEHQPEDLRDKGENTLH